MAKRKNNAGTVKKKQITEKNLKANRNYTTFYHNLNSSPAVLEKTCLRMWQGIWNYTGAV